MKSKKNKLKPYPTWICDKCGRKAMKEQGIRRDNIVATYHIDTCEVCGSERECTDPRDYGYPEFKGFSG